MGFIDYKGTKEDRYSEVLEYARTQQEQDWKNKQNIVIKKWIADMNEDAGLADLFIQDILKMVIIKYRDLSKYEGKLFTDYHKDISMSQLWKDYLMDLIMRHIQPYHLNIVQKKAYFDSFYFKIFKIGNEKISNDFYENYNNHEYRRYMIECFDPTWKDQQLFRLLYYFCEKDKYQIDNLCSFLKIYRKLGLYMNLYLYHATQTRENSWMIQEKAEWDALYDIEEKVRTNKLLLPDENKLINPLYMNGEEEKNSETIESNQSIQENDGLEVENNNVLQSKLKKKEFYKLIENGDITSYIRACFLLLECELPNEIEESYRCLTVRMPVLQDAIEKFDEKYHADMYQFEEYYAPETLKLTAVYLDYQAAGPSEEIISETKKEVSIATQKLLQVVNEKIDEIYRFVTMDAIAEAKALDAIMSQDGYVNSDYKIK